MYRSFYVILTDCEGSITRVDCADFARPFGLYRSCEVGGSARLFGVDRLDRSILLGERC
jgi:hypothetical protein